MTKPTAPTTTHRDDRAEQQALRPQDDRVGDVHAQHVERAVRDVDDLHHAEGERQPAGDQEQQRRGEQAVEGLGDEVGHRRKQAGQGEALESGDAGAFALTPDA